MSGEAESGSTHEMTESDGDAVGLDHISEDDDERSETSPLGSAHEESSGVTKFLVLDDSLVMDSDAVELDHGTENLGEEPEATHVESSEEEQSSPDESDPPAPPLRTTNREPIPRKLFIYPKLGSKPVYTAPIT